MEKLQAALAKARAQREGVPVGKSGHPELSAKAQSRAAAHEEALEARWQALQEFTPDARRIKQSRIFASSVSADSTQFDILRTKLILEARKNGWSRIAITSPAASSGKSTTACNLIAGLGRQPEVRGMLFDFDFRRPAIAKMFGAEPLNSFSDVLEDKVSFQKQALRLHPNTSLSVTTRALRDPASILHRHRTAEILDEIQADYLPDLMLFDLPPVLVSDETRAFLKLVDAVLIVASAEATTVSQVDECEREVAQYTSVAGVVLNKCRFLEDGYGYSY